MDDEALLAQLIVCEPRQSADAATLAGSNVPVWQIIRDLKAAKGDVLAVAADYGLPRELVLAVDKAIHQRQGVQPASAIEVVVPPAAAAEINVNVFEGTIENALGVEAVRAPVSKMTKGKGRDERFTLNGGGVLNYFGDNTQYGFVLNNVGGAGNPTVQSFSTTSATGAGGHGVLTIGAGGIVASAVTASGIPPAPTSTISLPTIRKRLVPRPSSIA